MSGQIAFSCVFQPGGLYMWDGLYFRFSQVAGVAMGMEECHCMHCCGSNFPQVDGRQIVL